MNRLTTDNPQTNTETLLNYAYVKDQEVYLRYGFVNDMVVEDISLVDFVCACAPGLGCDELRHTDVLEGACIDCDGCDMSLIYILATQAAELRERLKHYEEQAENSKVPQTAKDAIMRRFTKLE